MKKKILPIEELLKEKPSLAKNINGNMNSIVIPVKVRDYEKYIMKEVSDLFNKKYFLGKVFEKNPQNPAYFDLVENTCFGKKEINNSNQSMRKLIDFVVNKGEQDNYIREISEFIYVQNPKREEMANSHSKDYFDRLHEVKNRGLISPGQARKDLLYKKTLEMFDDFMENYGMIRKEIEFPLYLERILEKDENSKSSP